MTLFSTASDSSQQVLNRFVWNYVKLLIQSPSTDTSKVSTIWNYTNILAETVRISYGVGINCSSLRLIQQVVQRTSGTCFSCGKPGHWRASCPNFHSPKFLVPHRPSAFKMAYKKEKEKGFLPMIEPEAAALTTAPSKLIFKMAPGRLCLRTFLPVCQTYRKTVRWTPRESGTSIFSLFFRNLENFPLFALQHLRVECREIGSRIFQDSRVLINNGSRDDSYSFVRINPHTTKKTQCQQQHLLLLTLYNIFVCYINRGNWWDWARFWRNHTLVFSAPWLKNFDKLKFVKIEWGFQRIVKTLSTM